MERALVLAALLAAAGAVNYCGAKMCAGSDAHTYCQFTPGPGPRCTGYIEDPLSFDEKERVLARLNRRRAEAARGVLKQLPTAGNMLKLRWVEELSREAQRWADQCAPPDTPEEHDVCRDLCKTEFGYSDSISVGQCVASVVGEAPGLRAETLADTWFLQGLQYRGNISYSASYGRSHMDFAQMLWAHTYLVGCARSRFMTDVNGRLRTVIRLVCNMAPRGPAGALWLPAAPASACPPRSAPDKDIHALCSYPNDTIDIYDVSNEMTLEEQIVLNAVLEIERNASLDRHGSLDEIYLTNLAIATLSHITATEPYPSIQKRDIIEPIFKEDKEIDETKAFIDDVIAKLVREKTTREPQAIRPKIVGRPKSYRIEELDTGISDQDLKYTKTRIEIETTTMRDPDAYVEYEFQESSEKVEEDVTVSITESEVQLPSISTVDNVNQNLIENTIEVATTRTTSELPPSPIVDSSLPEWNVTNNELRRILELSKKSEDYPSDPETARQLQEALERMERSLAEENTVIPVKVRRELPRPPQEEPYQSLLQGPQTPRPLVEELMKNNSMSKPPVIDLMMKYLPFMKNYQGFRSAASSAKLDMYLCVLILYV